MRSAWKLPIGSKTQFDICGTQVFEEVRIDTSSLVHLKIWMKNLHSYPLGFITQMGLLIVGRIFGIHFQCPIVHQGRLVCGGIY